MPARVVRAEINASDSLSRVSIEADLTFRCLITVVDDYGRTDARLPILKGALYPMRDVALGLLDAWLDELTDEGCVQRYEVDGRPYLRLTGWERHRGRGRRAGSSKYPAPPVVSGASAEILGSEGVSEETQSNLRMANSAFLGSSCSSAETQSNPPVGRGTRDEGRGAGGAPPPLEDPPDSAWSDAATERHRRILADANPTIERFHEPRFGIEREHWGIEYARLGREFGRPVVEKALNRLEARAYWQGEIRDPKDWRRNHALEKAAAEWDRENATERSAEEEAMRRQIAAAWGDDEVEAMDRAKARLVSVK